MFVGQLSSDEKANLQIIENLRQGKDGGTLDLGRFVDPQSFAGLDTIRTTERMREAERRFGAQAVKLGDLATSINLGRFGEGFAFESQDNAIFVPLIGISDVVDSVEDITLKKQNYAQVVVDPSRSKAQFVARFLNSELGREIREQSKTGAVIPKLNTQIHALHCRPRRGVFENEVAVLVGSNSEFLNENRSMTAWLDVERLYLSRKDSGRALKLLPLVQIGPSPLSARNACYFFNRLERDGGARFVSYHFSDKPELRGQFTDATDTIRALMQS